MPKQRTYCFTALSEMRGLIAPSSWAQPDMRAAINVGTGPWFCYFVNGKFKAAADLSRTLVQIGFRHAYGFARTEPDSRALATAAYRYRAGKIPYEMLYDVLSDLQQKYGRRFESLPLIVANRLAAESPCAVASAACIDAVKVDPLDIVDTVLDSAMRVWLP